MPTLDRASDLLLIVDLQPDFMPGGALAVAEGDLIVPPILALCDRFDRIIATQDWHPAGHVSYASTHGRKPFATIERHGSQEVLWPDHCLQGSPGASLPSELTDRCQAIIRKGWRRDVDSYSAFRENTATDGSREKTGLAGYCREVGVRRIFVAGLARDYCVLWSAEDGAAAGFEVVLLDDLTRPVDPANAEETNRRLANAGVAIASSSDL